MLSSKRQNCFSKLKLSKRSKNMKKNLFLYYYFLAIYTYLKSEFENLKRQDMYMLKRQDVYIK